MNFWQKLKEQHKPFTVLAPMDDVTDFVFREIIATEIGKENRPDVFITEFTSVDALTTKGFDSQISRLKYSKGQRPIAAQIWGREPEKFFKIAKLVRELNFDGIDINMGCPDKTIIKNGSCSALIQNPNLAAEIIQATKEGAEGMPVSVKTRLGFRKLETDTWIPFLLNQNLDALTIHGRIASQMSQKPANWHEIGKCVKFKNEIAPNTVIIGNGDIKSYTMAVEASTNYDVDGVMIGRGVFENILAFNKSKNSPKLEKNELIDLYIKHIKLFEKT
jgi:tRNA-dihydrouridine synthase